MIRRFVTHEIVLLVAIWVALIVPASFSLATAAYPDGPAAARPGRLVSQEPLDGAPGGAAAWRILYRSTGMDGKPIMVSGVVIIPLLPPPPGGRPIVAWAHPTTGVVSPCAPSLALFGFQQIQGLRDMLARGYVVVVTDYPGLGTAEPHPYLVGDSEARAVIDSVRAARQMPEAAAGNRFAVWGHSQGGQAALFTGLIEKNYAPELNLVGVAAAAPATDLGTLLSDDFGTVGGKNLLAMTLWSWAQVYGAPIHSVVEPAAMPTVNMLAGECIESLYDLVVRHRTERPLEQRFLSVRNITDIEPWRSLLALNSPGALPPGIPVFLAQGEADRLVQPAVTRAYMTRLCQAGSRVRLVLMPGVGHGFAAHDSAPAAIAWIADRFSGAPAPNDCDS